MKFAICNEIFRDWKLEEAFSYAAKLGYHGVEIAPFTIAKSVVEIMAADRTRIREQAARVGIEIAGIHWVLVGPEGMHINHPEAAVRERTSRYLCDLANFCADIGGSVMVLGSPKQRNIMPNVSADQAREWTLNTLREAVGVAGQRQLTICLEPLAPAETNFINTAQEAVQFIQEFDSPNLKVLLDVKAMCSEAKPIPQIIGESWPHFAHFHANDKNLKGPGFGDVDFGPIAAALKKIGYKGFVSVEVFNFDEGAETIARKSLEYLRQKFA